MPPFLEASAARNSRGMYNPQQCQWRVLSIANPWSPAFPNGCHAHAFGEDETEAAPFARD
jgi:hypothetical protein